MKKSGIITVPAVLFSMLGSSYMTSVSEDLIEKQEPTPSPSPSQIQTQAQSQTVTGNGIY